MAQGAGKFADGVYSRHPWTAPAEAAFPPQEYLGPFQSNQERLMSQSLAVHMMTGKEIQEHVRPNLPQIELFPDRYGFVTTELSIEDIITSRGRVNPRHDYSGEPTTTESTSTNTLGPTI